LAVPQARARYWQLPGSGSAESARELGGVRVPICADRYRAGDLPPAPDLAVVEFEDPYAPLGWINPEGTLDPNARRRHARRADGSVAEGEPEWVAPPRPRVRGIARLKEDPIGRIALRHQVDQAQYLGAREYQRLYDATQVALVRSVDLSKAKVSGGQHFEPLTDARQRASRKLNNADSALMHWHGAEGLLLVRDVLCERRPVEQAGRLRGANNDRETHWFAVLFRKCLSVLAVQFGFASSMRRPWPLMLNGDGEADPALDPGRYADACDLADVSLRRGRGNGVG
jgi:hypothetical protein